MISGGNVHLRSIKDFLPFRHRDLLVIPISEYLESFLVSKDFEDGHSVGFRRVESRHRSAAVPLSHPCVIENAFVSADDRTTKVVI